MDTDKIKVTMKTLLLSVAVIFTSCNTTKTLQGGAIGAGAGGTIGGLII